MMPTKGEPCTKLCRQHHSSRQRTQVQHHPTPVTSPLSMLGAALQVLPNPPAPPQMCTPHSPFHAAATLVVRPAH